MAEEIKSNYGTAAPASENSNLNDLEKAYAGGQELNQGIQQNYEMLFEYLPLFMSGVLTPKAATTLVKTSPRLGKILSNFFRNPNAVKNKATVEMAEEVVKKGSSVNNTKEWTKMVKDFDIQIAKELKKGRIPRDVNPRVSPNFEGFNTSGVKAGRFPTIGERGYMQDIAGNAFEKRKLTKSQYDDINNWINRNFPKKEVQEIIAKQNPSAGEVVAKFPRVDAKLFNEFNEMGVSAPFKTPRSYNVDNSMLGYAQDLAADPKLIPTAASIFGAYKATEYLVGDETPQDPSGGEWQVPETLPSPYEPGMTSTDSLTQRMSEPQNINVTPLAPSYDFEPMEMIQSMSKEDNIF